MARRCVAVGPHAGGARPQPGDQQRSDLAGWADYGYCSSHSRWFWGLRLHLIAAPSGLPIAYALDPSPPTTTDPWNYLSRAYSAEAITAGSRVAGSSGRSSQLSPVRCCWLPIVCMRGLMNIAY